MSDTKEAEYFADTQSVLIQETCVLYDVESERPWA